MTTATNEPSATTPKASQASRLPCTRTHNETTVAATAWPTKSPLRVTPPSSNNGGASEAMRACRYAENPSASAPTTRRIRPVRSVRRDVVWSGADMCVLSGQLACTVARTIILRGERTRCRPGSMNLYKNTDFDGRVGGSGAPLPEPLPSTSRQRLTGGSGQPEDLMVQPSRRTPHVLAAAMVSAALALSAAPVASYASASGSRADAATTAERPAPYTKKTPLSRGSGGAVTSVDPEATRIGLRVLRHGGNAVDAAVATAAALGVTEPYSAGIGGGG